MVFLDEVLWLQRPSAHLPATVELHDPVSSVVTACDVDHGLVLLDAGLADRLADLQHPADIFVQIRSERIIDVILRRLSVGTP
ncbi:MAG: hypothetical protein ACLRTA_02425 [Clostridia bacterium]